MYISINIVIIIVIIAVDLVFMCVFYVVFRMSHVSLTQCGLCNSLSSDV